MEIPVCSMQNFQRFTDMESIELLNDCYYVILSKQAYNNNGNAAEVPQNKELIREARGRYFDNPITGGDLTEEYKQQLIKDLENIEINDTPGNYLFLFKLDISQDNKYNNSQIFNDICNGSTIGEGDYVTYTDTSIFTGKTNYIVKKTVIDDKYKKICFLKKIDGAYKEVGNIIIEQANKLKNIKPLLPIKFINGIVINLDDFKKVTETGSYNPDIFEFLKKLKVYIQRKYDRNGELLTNILQQGIESKELNILLSALLNKSNYNIFGNKNFSKQYNSISDIKDSLENEIPEEVYFKIFLQIMYKIVYTNPIYKTAKITNIRDNKCRLITYNNNNDNTIRVTANNDMTIFENDFNEIINYNTDTIKKSSDIFIEYENPINFIIKYFENSEIGSYTDCNNIQYYNVFKNKLSTVLSIINNDKIIKAINETGETGNKVIKNIFNNIKAQVVQGPATAPAAPAQVVQGPATAPAAPVTAPVSQGPATAPAQAQVKKDNLLTDVNINNIVSGKRKTTNASKGGKHTKKYKSKRNRTKRRIKK